MNRIANRLRSLKGRVEKIEDRKALKENKEPKNWLTNFRAHNLEVLEASGLKPINLEDYSSNVKKGAMDLQKLKRAIKRLKEAED